MCERMCAKQIDTLVYSIGDSVIQACGFCNPRRGQRKRSSSTTGSVGEEGGAETLFSVLFTPPPSFYCPWGDTTAAAGRAPALNGGTVAVVRGAVQRSASGALLLKQDAAALLQLPGRSASSSGN